MNTIHLICNPISGKGSALESLNKIKEWVKTQNDIDLQVHLTENDGHATIITKDLTSTGKPVTIFVLGGDGSLNEVLNGIDNFENTKIGILPFGSGNDFAFSLGMKITDPVDVFHNLVTNAKEVVTDYILLNDKYRAINSIGVGLSADVIAYRNKMKHFSPKTQYKIATILISLFWKSKHMNLKIDNLDSKEIDSFWLTITNGKRIGSAIICAPDAKVDDGLLSLTYLKTFKNKLKNLGYLSKIRKGKIKELPIYNSALAKEINIDIPDSPVEYDGNLLEHQTHVNVKVIPNKIHFLINK